MATSEADANRQLDDDSHVTAQQWKWTILATVGSGEYEFVGSVR
jgi:hypothetical protein